MDVSVYIGELLYDHDCVVIPGFGGFICNYKPAEIHPVEHTVSPPSKAVLFNINLKSNDGLLVNYIAQREGIPLYQAGSIVTNWVGSSLSLLKRKEDLLVKNIGKLFSDIEGNIQFVPDGKTNYLKSSFGLKTITAYPVLKGKTIEFTEKFRTETKAERKTSGVWRIAAMLFLIAALGAILTLMKTGVEIKPLSLNEAGVFGFINGILKPAESEIKPLAVEDESVEPVVEITSAPETPGESLPVDETSSPSVAIKHSRYYIIVGAFKREKNIEAAKHSITMKYPDAEVITESAAELTRVGFLVGNDFNTATEQLALARQENSAYWLLEK